MTGARMEPAGILTGRRWLAMPPASVLLKSIVFAVLPDATAPDVHHTPLR